MWEKKGRYKQYLREKKRLRREKKTSSVQAMARVSLSYLVNFQNNVKYGNFFFLFSYVESWMFKYTI